MYDHAQNLNIVQLAPSRDRLPLFIVGDVHGCAWELKELLKVARQRVPQFQLVLVGDLFTKGPDPVGVYETIREYNGICIKGNHDWALQALLQNAGRKTAHNLPEHSQQTLYLIRHHKKAILQFLLNLPHALKTEVVLNQPPKGWEPQYPLAVVHAGIDCTKGLIHSSERMLLTARYVKWDTQMPPGPNQRLLLVPVAYRQEALAPKTEGAPEGVVVEPPDIEKLRVTGERFRWHELHTGPELIVFGHDAKQGLFRKTNSNGRPVCVGIDTGCTYGRSLTGYFPETDDALQVASKRAHFDVHRNIILVKTPHVKAAV